MSVVIINQARMTSTRLPGKVLKKVLGKPLLEYMVERLRRVPGADRVVIATSANATDNVIAELCRVLGVDCFRGEELDVLSRFHGAASKFRADVVVRVTSDCPLIDPALVGRLIAAFVAGGSKFDYGSNVEPRTYPRGMDAEIFTFAALDRAAHEAHLDADREHVTPYIIRSTPAARRLRITGEVDLSGHRWTLDTIEDFQLIENILSAVYPDNAEFTLADCVRVVDAHPQWSRLNRWVRQNGAA